MYEYVHVYLCINMYRDSIYIHVLTFRMCIYKNLF
jgi:hypothetical protein